MLLSLLNSPPRLLLAQTGSFSFAESNLEPQFLTLRATMSTAVLRNILAREGDQWPLHGMPAPALNHRRRRPATDCHEHGGLND